MKDYNKQEYLKLLSKEYKNITEVSEEIINLKAILNLPKGTEVFLSDIHGEYAPFTHILNNGAGIIRSKIDEIFENQTTEKERNMLATLIYYPEEKLKIIKEESKENLDEWYTITLYRLVEVARKVSSKYTRSKVRKAIKNEFAYIIDELLHAQRNREKDKVYYYKQIIKTIIELGQADSFIIAISELIKQMAVDHLHVIGDIFDRGRYPNLVIEKLMKFHSLDIQWGNHDILWMGAASGEKTCIANALRISARYSNLDIIEDIYGINLLPLATFALEQYKSDPCNCFMPKGSAGETSTKEKTLIAKMHKAISIIQFKLEGEVIKRRPEFEMDHRLLLDKINYEEGTINLKGNIYKLKDTNFPTIDPKNPYKLTKEEEIVIDKLVSSFKNSEKLQKHVSFLFSKGSIYLVSNGNLLIHGCVPLNEDKSFMKMKLQGQEYSGRELMDKMETLVREGYLFKDKTNQKQYGMDIMWYLWTGKCSSLFGKDDMTTFERYFIAEKETHKENKNPYFTLREDEDVCNKIFKEFELDTNESHIINGHVPVESKNGESPIKANGRIIAIDGGFSRAYQKKTGIAGYTLIYNSQSLQLVSHDPFTSTEEAIVNESDILSTTMLVEHKLSRKTVKDTDAGKKLLDEVDDLKLLLTAYKKGIIKEV